jgi:ribosomal protein S18 acetylase RimI-like enzyme
VSEPESPAPLCACASPPLPSDTAAPELSAAVSNTVAEEAEPVPSEGSMEICGAVNGEAAAAGVSAAAPDAAALAACNADAADPVASEPSLSARLMRAVLASGVCAALAALSAGAADEADEFEGAAVCAGRLPAVVPVPDVGGWSFELDTELGVARAPAIGVAAADDLAARVTAVAAAEASLDCAVADAAGTAAEAAAEPSVAVSASAAGASSAVVAAVKTAPCAAAAFCGEPGAGVDAVIAGSMPAAALDGAVPGVTAPVAPGVAAATAGVAVSEASSSPSSRLGEAAGVPFGLRSCAGSTGAAGAAAGVAAAGGVTLPEGGKASPLRLPAPGLAGSSLRLCLAEARSSAPAKSRGLEALAAASADVAAFCELSGGGACRGTATTGVRMARMAAFMFQEVASDVPSAGVTLHRMRLEVTDAPRECDEAFVIAQTRAYNATFAETDVRSLCVFARDDAAAIIGGLTGRTYWRYLDIAFLWVDEKYRGRGLATQLMSAAESEARNRGCEHVFLDTLSFQALGFYQKLGYTEFGRLSGFSGKHDRYWLRKSLG